MEGKSPSLAAAARKKRRQSMASRRVSFAVDTALESVREFQKDENAADQAFPDPSVVAAAAAQVPPKPPAVATVASCPPPGPAPAAPSAAASPFGKGPAASAAEAAFAAAFSPAASAPAAPEATPEPAAPLENRTDAAPVDPFAAFGVSPANSAGRESLGNLPRMSIASYASGPADVTGTDLDLGTPASTRAPGSVAPSSAAPSSAGNDGVSPGSMFTAHLPRRVTMDPGQYREAMKAMAAEEATIDVSVSGVSPGAVTAAVSGVSPGAVTAAVPGLSALADEDDDAEASAMRGGGSATDGFTFDTGAITAAVPGLSALADEDDDAEASAAVNGGSAADETDDFGEAGDDTLNMLAGLKEAAGAPAPIAAPGDITAAVPSLSALADDDDVDDDAKTAAVQAPPPLDASTNSEQSPAVGGLPMGSVTEDVAADLAADLAAKVAAENAAAMGLAHADVDGAATIAVPDVAVASTPASAAKPSDAQNVPKMFAGDTPGSEDATRRARRQSMAAAAAVAGADAKKRRLTLGVLGRDSMDVVVDAVPAATPTLTDLTFGGEGTANGVAEDKSADDMNLSDSFEVPPGADEAAASVAANGITATVRFPSERLDGITATVRFPSSDGAATDTWDSAPKDATGGANSSDAFSAPGEDTMRALLKMKEGAHGDALSEPASDPEATKGGDTTEERTRDATSTFTSGRPSTTTDTWGEAPAPKMKTPAVAGSEAKSSAKSSPAPSSSGTVTPANQSVAESEDGFTPGPDTLLMMEKLKGRQHGQAALDSVRRTIVPGRPSWAASPLPPIGGAMGAAFTPNKTATIAGGFSGFGGFGGFGAATGAGAESTRRSPFGASVAAPALFTPGAAQREQLRGAKAAEDFRALRAACPGIPPLSAEAMDGGAVDLETFFRACEVSFMDAKNLRRKSLAMESLCNAPPPETLTEGLRLVCLTAPLIEAMDPMHDHLSESLSALASGIDDARREVEAAQPPLLRLAASENPAHQEALRKSGKALKKQCQLAAKDAFTKHRLAAEESVARSLAAARAALDRTTRALAQSREIAAETSQAADTHEVDLRRRLAASADVAGRQAARMRTRVGKLSALAERRARLAKTREALAAANADVERLQRRGGEMDAERERATAALEEARLAAAEEGVDAADGGASARAAAAARVRAAAEAARTAGDELAVLNRVAPWRLEKVTGVGGGELTLRVGRLFRVMVDVGTGAGRVTLAESSGVTPAGGCAFAAAVAGAPRAWSETSPEACAGDVTAVLQRVVPALRRAEKTLEEAEECRSAFPRVARVRCTAGGDLELSFVDFAMERKIDVALTAAAGAYPRGGLTPRVTIVHHGDGPKLPSAAGIEAAIDRVPAGESGRRLFGICRLVDWIVARGEQGMGDAAQRAAVAAKPAPPAPAPPILVGASRGLPIVRPREESGAVREEENILAAEDKREAAAEDAAAEDAAAEDAREAAPPPPRPEPMSLTEEFAHLPQDTEDVPPIFEDTENVPPMDATEDAKTPAGFNKGSNPLFDDSMEMDAGAGEEGDGDDAR